MSTSQHPTAVPDLPTMRAIVQTEYGAPDVLRLATVNRPVPSDNGVLVKVRATSVDAGVWHLMRAIPFLVRFIYGGLRRPKYPILGAAIAGQVVAVGQAVTQFQPGDAVFGNLSESGFGGFAEYVCAPEAALAPKPNNLSFAAAATVPESGLTALQGLRDMGQLRAGQAVLILGASGGVGSFAVQIAKAEGAEVTAVCRTSKIERVQQLGADHILDATQIDVTQAGQKYDLILDAAAYRPFSDYLPVLTPTGTYVLVGGATRELFRTLLFGPWFSKRRGQQIKCLVSRPNQTDLLTLKALLEAEKITPMIDRTYPLSEVPAAIRYLEERQVQGKVVIQI